MVCLKWLSSNNIVHFLFQAILNQRTPLSKRDNCFLSFSYIFQSHRHSLSACLCRCLLGRVFQVKFVGHRSIRNRNSILILGEASIMNERNVTSNQRCYCGVDSIAESLSRMIDSFRQAIETSMVDDRSTGGTGANSDYWGWILLDD